MKGTCGQMHPSARRSRCNDGSNTYTPGRRGQNIGCDRMRMLMADSTLLFRISRPMRSIPLLAIFMVGFAAPATAEDAPLPYELTTPADTALAPGIGGENPRPPPYPETTTKKTLAR